MKEYHLSFYDFQPLDLSADLLILLYQKNIHLDKLYKTFFMNEKYPEWIRHFDKVNDAFHSLHSVVIETETKNDFLDKLKESLLKKSESAYFSQSKIQAFLIFDPRFMSFILSIEVKIVLQEKQLLELNCSAGPNLYLCIRDLLVDDDNHICNYASSWVASIKRAAINKSEEICKFIFTKSKNGAITIKPNTGNISCVLTAFNKGNSCHIPEAIQKCLININRQAERLGSDYPPIKLPNKFNNTVDVLDFNGRMHTLIINTLKDEFRYIPILFHMQFMWFYIKTISPYFSNKIVSVICNKSSKGKYELEENIYSLVKRIEILSIYNEQFKFSIEIDNERMYDRIQNRWSIEKTLKQLQKNAASFGSHASRDNQQIRDKSDQFKNGILAIISIIQILALTSIWNDHLSLMDRSPENNPNFYSAWIEIISINLLPSLLILSTILGLLFLLLKKK